MPRVLLTIEFLGTRYAGWQRQENALAVQQVVEEALATICKEHVVIHSSGRTDSGVHALGMRAHADIPYEIPDRGLILGMNARLPHDVRIRAVERVADDFHARFSAKRKTYLYQIWNDAVANPFFDPTHAHVPRSLDVDRMRDAAQALVGRHDFRSFSIPEPEVSSTVRTIERAEVTAKPQRVQFRVTADGFIRYQVRRMAGILIQVGIGVQPVKAVADALEPLFAESRWTADARGLVLESVEYV
ncbi:MAG: tRNA pseudouridine(38-40) synthase TruA [Acidobacteria bacterium]|nr:tRNA pseudouridine(38-40) synthase TruA [Acidobacteriota bacterium]